MFNKKEKEESAEDRPIQKVQKLIAKKDFVIHHNEIHIEIKKGDAVSVPEKFLPNLKTEGVI